jgi:hypothetical protein
MYPTKSTTTLYAAPVNLLVFKERRGSVVRLVGIHTYSQDPVSESSAWETELAIENFERYHLALNVQIQAEMNLSEVKTLFPNNHKIIVLI